MLAGHWGVLRWAVALAAVLALVALIAIWRSRPHSPRAKVVWTIVALFLPVLGPLGWFLLGRQRRRLPH